MKKILLIFISILFFLSCSSNAQKNTVVKIGHVGESDRTIWKPVIEKLAKEGITVELISFADYTLPNQALNDGEIDLNAFQHFAYFNNELETKNYDLTAIGTTFISAMNIYSKNMSLKDAIGNNGEYAIEVQDVYKTFNVYLDKANSLKEKMLFWKRNRKEVRQVLKGINLNIKKGEAVALIGVNGSGKSTLLKLMTKIIYPNQGKIIINGKLTSLLELGAGFHPDFSGRENIYFNASIFGLTKKQIDDRLEQIIEFSELRDYIDNPVRTYSSGMFMRLAFAVAINVDADILLVDEILSVGDQHFQEKCINKMKQLKKEGKTMVFVTHSLDSAKELCDRAVWLSNGVLKLDGETNKVIEKYIKETA